MLGDLVAVDGDLDADRQRLRAAGIDADVDFADGLATHPFGGFHRGTDRLLGGVHVDRSDVHTYELQSLMRNTYAVVCLKKKTYLYQYIIQEFISSHILY